MAMTALAGRSPPRRLSSGAREVNPVVRFGIAGREAGTVVVPEANPTAFLAHRAVGVHLRRPVVGVQQHLAGGPRGVGPQHHALRRGDDRVVEHQVLVSTQFHGVVHRQLSSGSARDGAVPAADIAPCSGCSWQSTGSRRIGPCCSPSWPPPQRRSGPREAGAPRSRRWPHACGRSPAKRSPSHWQRACASLPGGCARAAWESGMPQCGGCVSCPRQRPRRSPLARSTAPWPNSNANGRGGSTGCSRWCAGRPRTSATICFGC